jgi:flavin reductase (DIM6/NTAB) family NADH-FMN oxidoreductase RutF
LLDEATAYLEATVDRTLDAGDHSVIVGRVTALEVRKSDAEPLIYYRSGYRRLD